MSLTLNQFKTEIEAIYEPLLGKAFVSIHERRTEKVSTGGPRDIVSVDSPDVCKLMGRICVQIMEVSKKFEPHNLKEKVWKGIINSTLWVLPYKGGDTDTEFRVVDIEVVTDLEWKQSYKALVNITLHPEVNKEE